MALNQVAEAFCVNGIHPVGHFWVALAPCAQGHLWSHVLAVNQFAQTFSAFARSFNAGDSIDQMMGVRSFPVIEQGGDERSVVGEVVIERAFGHAQRLAKKVNLDVLWAFFGEGEQALLQPLGACELHNRRPQMTTAAAAGAARRGALAASEPLATHAPKP